jgi:hypothetical protein
MTFFNVIVKPGCIDRVTQFIEVNHHGEVTDTFQKGNINLIRSDLYLPTIGNVIVHEDVLSIEKPVKCAR